MRKFAIFTIAVAVFALLSGCETLDRWRDYLREKFSETADNVQKKVDEVGGQIEKTRQSVEQKAADVQNAVKKVRDAIDAVSKVTGSDAPPAPANPSPNPSPSAPNLLPASGS